MIEFHPAAESEMLDASERYEREKEGLGLRFLTEVERVSFVISGSPRIGAVWTYSEVPEGVRRHPLRTFPFHVVYVEDPRLVIVAVAQMSRRPGYWRHRLDQI